MEKRVERAECDEGQVATAPVVDAGAPAPRDAGADASAPTEALLCAGIPPALSCRFNAASDEARNRCAQVMSTLDQKGLSGCSRARIFSPKPAPASFFADPRPAVLRYFKPTDKERADAIARVLNGLAPGLNAEPVFVSDPTTAPDEWFELWIRK